MKWKRRAETEQLTMTKEQSAESMYYSENSMCGSFSLETISQWEYPKLPKLVFLVKLLYFFKHSMYKFSKLISIHFLDE